MRRGRNQIVAFSISSSHFKAAHEGLQPDSCRQRCNQTGIHDVMCCLCRISIEQQKLVFCYLCRNACCLRVTASCSMIFSTSIGHLPMYRFRLSTWSVLLTACMDPLQLSNQGADSLSALRLLVKCCVVTQFSNHSLVNLPACPTCPVSPSWSECEGLSSYHLVWMQKTTAMPHCICNAAPLKSLPTGC